MRSDIQTSPGWRWQISRLVLTACVSTALLLASASSAAAFGFITKWGKQGNTAGRFNHSQAIATDRTGHVYVTDQSNRIQKFTARGAFLTQWRYPAASGAGRKGSENPIATDRAGHVYVVGGDNRVQKFTSRGRFITKWAVRGQYSFAIATDRAGNVYVGVDKWIEKFTSKGVFLTRWRNRGPGAIGRIGNALASGIATDAAGHVYVSGRASVNKFTSTGSFLSAWGKNVGGRGVNVCTVTCFPAKEGRGEGEFKGPSGLATDRAGHVFVADLNRVQEFSSAGAFLRKFGRFGTRNGQFRSLHGIATDARGDLYVADTGNERVQKFGEPSSAFSLTRVRLDPRRGTARLVANVAGVGRLALVGPGIKGSRRAARGAGEVVLSVVPNASTRAKLEANGRARVKTRVTYTPTTPPGAAPATKSRRITLIKRR